MPPTSIKFFKFKIFLVFFVYITFIFSISANVTTHRYTFDNGNANDSVGTRNGNPTSNSTYLEAPTYSNTDRVSGMEGFSMKLGVNAGSKKSGFSINKNVINNSEGAYSVWARADSSASTNVVDYLVSALPLNTGIVTYLNSSQKLKMKVAGSSVSSNEINVGTTQSDWNHILVVWDENATSSNGLATFYLNGVQEATQTFNAGALNITTVRVGGFSMDDNSSQMQTQWTGAIDDLQFYNNSLSTTEVSHLYNNPGSIIKNYWDTNGASSGLGGAGTWDQGTTSNWSGSSTGAGSGHFWANDLNTYFGGTSGTVSVGSGGITVSGNLFFSSDAYTIQNNSITLNGTSQTIDVDSGLKVTISSVIAGSSGFNKTGSGGLVLTGSNTSSGTATVSSGHLWVNNSSGSATGTGAVVVSSGSTLGGSGSISGLVTINAGGSLAPGSADYTVGSLNFTNSGSDNTWYGNNSSSYIWNISDFSGSEGSGWDILTFTDSLNVINTSGLAKIYIESISGSGSLGLASNQNSSGSSIRILNTGGVGDFKLGGVTATNSLLDSYFQLDDMGYYNGFTRWWLTTDGQALFLNYEAVPEPSTWFCLMLLVAVLTSKLYKRNHKKGS
jgi:hypothetical protein